MEYFLIYRNKDLETVRIERQDCNDAAIEKLNQDEKSWDGEVVLCKAKNLRTLFKVFGEYRPKNWKEMLLKKEIL